MSKIIAVDFDETLCEHRCPNIGKPNANVIYNVLREQANGAKIILWTCREGKHLDEAVERFLTIKTNKKIFYQGGDQWRKSCILSKTVVAMTQQEESLS